MAKRTTVDKKELLDVYSLAPAAVEKLGVICGTAIKLASGNEGKDGYAGQGLLGAYYSGESRFWYCRDGIGVTYIPKVVGARDRSFLRIENGSKTVLAVVLRGDQIERVGIADFEQRWEGKLGLNFGFDGECRKAPALRT